MSNVRRVIGDNYSGHGLDAGAQVEFLRRADGVDWYTQGGEGDERAIDPRDLAMDDLIAISYDIENIYEDGTRITTHVQTHVPVPPIRDESGAYDDWEDYHVFEHTGADYPEGGDASYFVTVTQSSRPDLIPVGTEFEF